MAENNPGFLAKLFQSGATTFTTTIAAALATYFVTTNFKDKKQQETNHEKELIRVEAKEETSARIMAYESKVDSLTLANLRLQMQLDANKPENKNRLRVSDYAVAAPPVTRLNKLTQSLVNGTWTTYDGAEKWVFGNGQLHISSIKGYEGAFEAAGNYDSGGGKVNGQLHITRYLYLPVNMDASLELALGANNTVLTGKLLKDGNNSPIALYKQ